MLVETDDATPNGDARARWSYDSPHVPTRTPVSGGCSSQSGPVSASRPGQLSPGNRPISWSVSRSETTSGTDRLENPSHSLVWLTRSDGQRVVMVASV